MLFNSLEVLKLGFGFWIDVSEKCVKMIFQKVLTMEKIAQKTKVNKEGASAQHQN